MFSVARAAQAYRNGNQLYNLGKMPQACHKQYLQLEEVEMGVILIVAMRQNVEIK